SHNRSWNCGVEGETDDPGVRALRERQKRNLLVTLVLSQGVPMFLGGDEMGRTQRGNNNAYCQDNDLSWFDWSLRDENLTLLGFARRVMDFRRRHPVFRRRKWFQGRPIEGTEVSDIGWFNPDGNEMVSREWAHGFAKSIGVLLNGEGIPDPGPSGERITDDTFLLLFNAHDGMIDFTLPIASWGEEWTAVIDTNEPALDEGARSYKAGEEATVEGRSVMVLRRES
ncbi:MAG: glycogen debranching enzyme, partial [Actinomycetota bacterium]